MLDHVAIRGGEVADLVRLFVVVPAFDASVVGIDPAAMGSGAAAGKRYPEGLLGPAPVRCKEFYVIGDPRGFSFLASRSNRFLINYEGAE
jgi:hypothetical protein